MKKNPYQCDICGEVSKKQVYQDWSKPGIPITYCPKCWKQYKKGENK
jgi:hypothetical protein